jgi:hypothetical protein
MLKPGTTTVAKLIIVSALFCWSHQVQAGGAVGPATSSTVRWHAIGIVSGEALPFTTAAYFPRPLGNGELVDMVFTLDPSAAGEAVGSLSTYEGAITSVVVSGSDWALPMGTTLGRGAISIANDDPVYGDRLGLVAHTRLVSGSVWYGVELILSNPGTPNPGVGPWQPFTSLSLPTSAPQLGLFPGNVFYVQARRDQAGQALDGGGYYGQILSIEASVVTGGGQDAGKKDRHGRKGRRDDKRDGESDNDRDRRKGRR